MTRAELIAHMDEMGFGDDAELEFQVSDIYGNSEGCEVTFRRRGVTDTPQIRLLTDEHRLTKRSRNRYD